MLRYASLLHCCGCCLHSRDIASAKHLARVCSPLPLLIEHLCEDSQTTVFLSMWHNMRFALSSSQRGASGCDRNGALRRMWCDASAVSICGSRPQPSHSCCGAAAFQDFDCGPRHVSMKMWKVVHFGESHLLREDARLCVGRSAWFICHFVSVHAGARAYGPLAEHKLRRCEEICVTACILGGTLSSCLKSVLWLSKLSGMQDLRVLLGIQISECAAR